MAQAATPRQIIIYADASGNEPFSKWLEGLSDTRLRRQILIRLRRVEQGNYGDYKSLKDGVYELRLMYGPGYRVYFGEQAHQFVVLLCGGDKSSQAKDIEQAKTYWKEYQSHA